MPRRRRPTKAKKPYVPQHLRGVTGWPEEAIDLRNEILGDALTRPGFPRHPYDDERFHRLAKLTGRPAPKKPRRRIGDTTRRTPT